MLASFLMKAASLAYLFTEALEAFGEALLNSLLEPLNRSTSLVWQKAEDLFRDKVGIMPKELQQVKAS